MRKPSAEGGPGDYPAPRSRQEGSDQFPRRSSAPLSTPSSAVRTPVNLDISPMVGPRGIPILPTRPPNALSQDARHLSDLATPPPGLLQPHAEGDQPGELPGAFSGPGEGRQDLDQYLRQPRHLRCEVQDHMPDIPGPPPMPADPIPRFRASSEAGADAPGESTSIFAANASSMWMTLTPSAPKLKNWVLAPFRAAPSNSYTPGSAAVCACWRVLCNPRASPAVFPQHLTGRLRCGVNTLKLVRDPLRAFGSRRQSGTERDRRGDEHRKGLCRAHEDPVQTLPADTPRQ